MSVLNIVHVEACGMDFGFAITDNGKPVTSYTFRASHDAYCFAVGYASSTIEGLRTQRDFMQGEIERLRNELVKAQRIANAF